MAAAGPGVDDSVRVRYLHGRPGPHPQHRRLAESVGGEFEFVDFRMRWQDRNRSRLYVLISWIVCATTLPDRGRYRIFLIDNLHIWPVLMKRLLRRDQKIVVHLGSHTLYFLLTNRFTKAVKKLHLWALQNYDALICEGRMSLEMARDLLPTKRPPIYESFLGLPTDRMERLLALNPALESRRIVFIGNGTGEFRMHYKGLDLMIEAVVLARGRDSEIEFEIIGDWSEEIVERLIGACRPRAEEGIRFRGHVAASDALKGAALCLHCARGDAFPTATIEAMAAGVVTLVSEWTGTRQIVSEVSNQLIAPLDAKAIAERISWYFGLEKLERRCLSERSRAAARRYTEEAALHRYRGIFKSLAP